MSSCAGIFTIYHTLPEEQALFRLVRPLLPARTCVTR